MSKTMEDFIKELNAKYTEKDINGVARVVNEGYDPRGKQHWIVQCSFDSHIEFYDVWKNGDSYDFIRAYP